MLASFVLRRDVLRASAAIGMAGVAGCAGQNDGPDIGREVNIEDFEWEVDISDAQAAEDDRSLRVWNQGDYDDGVTWASHPVFIDPGQTYQIEATGQFWSESKSFNTIRHAVMRLGPDPPEVEDDFPQPGVSSTDFGETPLGGLREPLWLADDWREYTFEWTTPELSTDTLHFAVGTAVIWEAGATHYIDDLSVTIQPE